MKYDKNFIIIVAVLAFILRFFTSLYTFEFAVASFIPAILSSITVIVLFLIAQKIFDYETGIVAGFLLAILPWHIALAFQYVQAILFVLLVSLTLYFAVEKKKKLLVLTSIGSLIILVSILLQFQTIAEITHEQNKVIIRHIVGSRQGNILVIRLFHNKLLETIRFSLQRLSTYFEPQEFFLMGSYFFGKQIIGAGFMLTAVFPLFLAGLIQIARNNKSTWLLALVPLSVLPGVISIHVQHAILGSAMIPVLVLISSLALVQLARKSKTLGMLTMLLITLNFIFIFSQYNFLL